MANKELIEKAKAYWKPVDEGDCIQQSVPYHLAEFAEGYAAEVLKAERERTAGKIEKATPQLLRYNLCDDVNCLDDSPHRRH